MVSQSTRRNAIVIDQPRFFRKLCIKAGKNYALVLFYLLAVRICVFAALREEIAPNCFRSNSIIPSYCYPLDFKVI